MPETPLLAVRCPIDVLDQIESEKNLTGRSKTDVVIDRLRNSIPSLAVTDRHKLPAIAAIYQVFTSNNNLLYIGITDNLKQDWESHPLYGQFLESDVNSRITWYNSNLPVIDPNLVKKLNSVSDTVNTDRDSHSENMVSSDQLEYAIANSEIIKNIQSRLIDMDQLLRLQQSASIATSPLPPSPPVTEAIEPAIDTLPVPIQGTDEPVETDSSIETGTGAIETAIKPTIGDEPAIEDVIEAAIEPAIEDAIKVKPRRGYSNSELSEKINISKSTIEKWKARIQRGEKFEPKVYPNFFDHWILDADNLWYEIN
ncbi:MAG: hypothetical protein GPJ17_20525 [Microcystis aeruginosa K13-07]|jgi:hypothetical protein|nr:hypothetical protein [Microcystis aeruginosa K13-07]